MRIFLEHTQYWLYKIITDSNYRKFIKYSIIFGSKKKFVARIFKLNNYTLFAPDTLSFIWQYKEIFVDESYKFETHSMEPVIYDCGANIGVSCLYFNQKYLNARIVAIEADPKIAEILLQNLKSNNISNVEIITKAVWINDDGIDISLDGSDGASIYSKENVIKIPSLRLKNLILKEERIDLLKIDIEGAEHDVLVDCQDLLNKIDNIFIEFHSFLNSAQKLSEILLILEKNNFRYFIKPVNDRAIPFINKQNKSNPNMDLQLNIFAYKK